ncbi:MAG TPA: PF20097 family protein [Thermoanaerobaculia bacterium]|nr:PF20097 family protein [Thermoanaerobaculia bacterium]
MPSPSCPKCRTEMEEGFVPDHAQGAALVSSWVAGTPEPSVWFGLKLGGKDQRQIVTYRCPACGYLESYAR